MTITYSSSPEFARRQPAGSTLTEEQYAELNNRQAFLLPDINTGAITGDMHVGPAMTGDIHVGSAMVGDIHTSPRMTGRIQATKP